MATKKKTTKKVEEPVVTEEKTIIEEATPVVEEVKEEVKEETPVVKEKKSEKKEKTSKYPIGSIVYVSKDADADLNGFKLFPQYKKYTYTVEAYDAKSDIYTLRRLNLSLKLKGGFILAPNERAHDTLNRRQF